MSDGRGELGGLLQLQQLRGAGQHVDHVADVVEEGALQRGALGLLGDILQEDQEEALSPDRHGLGAHGESHIHLLAPPSGRDGAGSLHGPLLSEAGDDGHGGSAGLAELGGATAVGLVLAVHAGEHLAVAQTQGEPGILDAQLAQEGVVDGDYLSSLVQHRDQAGRRLQQALDHRVLADQIDLVLELPGLCALCRSIVGFHPRPPVYSCTDGIREGGCRYAQVAGG